MIVAVGSVVGWIVILTAFLLLNEVITRRWSLPGEVARKVAHLGSALLVMTSCLQLPFRSYLVIGPIFAVALLVARYRLPLRSLSARADTSWGEVLFGIGVAAAAGVAPDRGVFLASVGVLGLADTAAYVVGRRWPIRPLVLGRSLGGLSACAVIATLVCLPFGVINAIAAGAASGLVELVSPRGWDNVTVPLVAAGVLTVAG